MDNYNCNLSPSCNPAKKTYRCRCGKKERGLNFYAQFSVLGNPPSNTELPMTVLFQRGNRITLNDSTIILPPGYLYLIDFLFLATTEPDSYMQITPVVNGSLRGLYSFFAPSGSQERNVSASGSFTLEVPEGTPSSLSFYLTYPDAVRNIDISGAVSVTPLQRIS